MSVKIKGFNKLKKDIKNALKDIHYDAAKGYHKQIVNNLQPSKKSGNLLRSFKLKKGTNETKIVSELPYAAIQNFGGKIRITERMRKKMWALYKEFKLEVYKAIAITKKSYVTIKAKNYVKLNIDQLMKYLKPRITKKLKKI
jgi:phage gpG-like protein